MKNDVSARDPGKGRKAGLIAWLIIVVSFMSLYFAILNPVEEFFNIYVILGISLVFGLGGLAAFNIEIELQFDALQMRVLAEGIIGGLVLVVLQIMVSAVTVVAGAYLAMTPTEIALMAPAPEELIFTMIFYGTIRSATPAWPWQVAATSSSAMFAGFHYFAYGIDPIFTPILFAAGFVHAYLYERTRDIGTSMTSHLVVNGAPIMFAMAAVFLNYWWVGAVAISLYLIWMFGLRRR